MEPSSGIELAPLLAAALVMGVLMILSWLYSRRRRAAVARSIDGTVDDGQFKKTYNGRWRGRAVVMSRWKQPRESIPRWEMSTSFPRPLPLELEIVAGWGLREAHPANDSATVAAALDESLMVCCEDEALVLALLGRGSLRRVLLAMLKICNKVLITQEGVRIERRWLGSNHEGPQPVLEQLVAWAEDLERVLAFLEQGR